MLLGHTASARLDSCSGMMPVTLGKALTVTWAVLRDCPLREHTGFPELQLPSYCPQLCEPTSGEMWGPPNLWECPSLLAWSLCLKG